MKPASESEFFVGDIVSFHFGDRSLGISELFQPLRTFVPELIRKIKIR